MSRDSIEYYRNRAIAERTAAAKAENVQVAEIHAELARLYDALVEHSELRSTLRIVV